MNKKFLKLQPYSSANYLRSFIEHYICFELESWCGVVVKRVPNEILNHTLPA